MPAAMEAKLKQEAIKRRLKGKKANAFVFGTMRKTGWKPGNGDNNSSIRSKTTGSN